MTYLKFLFFLILVSCGKSAAEGESSPQKPTILVSLAPYQQLTQKIAGEEFLVQTIVPFGTNPHIYEPTPKQVMSLGKGSIWFRIGESFEKKILPVLEANHPNLTEIDLRAKVSLLHGSGCHCHKETLEDRHIWLSPQALAIQARTIAEALGDKYPEHKEKFLQNAEAAIQEIADLDAEVKEILTPAQHRSFLVSHPAFAYFCKDYHLTQLSLELEGKEPTSKHIAKIMQEAIESKATLALSMPQHSNKGLELVAEKLHLEIHSIDPYAPDYLETMRHLAHLVAEYE